MNDKNLIRALQDALFFWMPSIAGTDDPDAQRAEHDAMLLLGFEAHASDGDCYGDRKRAELKQARDALALRRIVEERIEYWRGEESMGGTWRYMELKHILEELLPAAIAEPTQHRVALGMMCGFCARETMHSLGCPNNKPVEEQKP